jgi:hypothetical protein
MTLPAGKRPGRNDPCYCGSGRKYKQCCLAKDDAEAAAARGKAAAAQTAAAATDETPATAEKTVPVPVRPPKHQTQQPWKASTSRGYIPKTRTPRKIGS